MDTDLNHEIFVVHYGSDCVECSLWFVHTGCTEAFRRLHLSTVFRGFPSSGFHYHPRPRQECGGGIWGDLCVFTVVCLTVKSDPDLLSSEEPVESSSLQRRV